MKNTIIYLLILFSSVSSYLFGNDKLPFDLKVIGDDDNLNELVRSKFNEQINDQEGLRYRTEEERAVVDVYIYPLQHINSAQNQNFISISIAHSHYRNIVNVVSDVFADNSNASENLKYYSAGLMREGGGQFMYISNAIVDDKNKLDSIVNKILDDLSLRISGYYFGPD